MTFVAVNPYKHVHTDTQKEEENAETNDSLFIALYCILFYMHKASINRICQLKSPLVYMMIVSFFGFGFQLGFKTWINFVTLLT